MADVERIAVIGVGPFAEAVAEAVHRSPGHRLERLARPDETPPQSAHLALSVASTEARLAAVERALDAGLPVVTLPFASADEAAMEAVATGRVTQISPLRGFGAIEKLRDEVRQEKLGRPYGLFAAHRVRRDNPALFESVGVPLLHLVCDLLPADVVRVQVTRASLFGHEPDAWFVIARADDETLATVEFAASLPFFSPASEQILIEATGSDAVLRAEPTRQVVTVAGRDGRVTQRAWWADLARPFVRAAVEAIQEPDLNREQHYLRFLRALLESAQSARPAEVE